MICTRTLFSGTMGLTMQYTLKQSIVLDPQVNFLQDSLTFTSVLKTLSNSLYLLLFKQLDFLRDFTSFNYFCIDPDIETVSSFFDTFQTCCIALSAMWWYAGWGKSVFVLAMSSCRKLMYRNVKMPWRHQKIKMQSADLTYINRGLLSFNPDPVVKYYFFYNISAFLYYWFGKTII